MRLFNVCANKPSLSLSLLFLSPGIVYWVQTLLHRCDSNAVFIVDVSRVYAISSSEDGKKRNQRVHTHCISENF